MYRAAPTRTRVALSAQLSPAAVERRWQLLPVAQTARDALLDAQTLSTLEQYRGSIENCIGAVKVPVGLAGPLHIEGAHAHGAYYLPLATTEAALVASYSRGAQLISEAGGCVALVLAEGIGRSPGFAFGTLREAARFVEWALAQRLVFNGCVAQTTSHGRLKEMRAVIEGNHVYLHLDFITGDAAGQNMVTLATEAICAYILAETPVQPRYWFLEANYSGDKKASARAFVGVRGSACERGGHNSGGTGAAAPAYDPRTHGRLLPYGRAGRRLEWHARRTGPVRQRAGRALSRHRARCRLCRGVGGRRHPHGVDA